MKRVSIIIATARMCAKVFNCFRAFVREEFNVDVTISGVNGRLCAQLAFWCRLLKMLNLRKDLTNDTYRVFQKTASDHFWQNFFLKIAKLGKN